MGILGGILEKRGPTHPGLMGRALPTDAAQCGDSRRFVNPNDQVVKVMPLRANDSDLDVFHSIVFYHPFHHFI